MCLNCDADNLDDYPLCKKCRIKYCMPELRRAGQCFHCNEKMNKLIFAPAVTMHCGKLVHKDTLRSAINEIDTLSGEVSPLQRLAIDLIAATADNLGLSYEEFKRSIHA